MKKTNNKGFSLVELIIVIAIMAVLIGVLAPQFIQYVAKSRVSTDLQNVEEMVVATDTYATDHESFTTADKNTAISISGSVVTLNADVASAYGIKNTYTLKGDWSAEAPKIEYTDASGWKRTGKATVKGGTYSFDGTFSAD
ncbi:MAG: type II secretion system GspH family protein [Lachnospiraceae bacterium]|nr:type II secretion system GspH family protein [Lachnospiraceae bacterium]